MARSWRVAAANTHLYPGAKLRCLDTPQAEPFAAGDRVILEFSDGNIVFAAVEAIDATRMLLRVPAHETGRGAPIAARRWRAERGTQPGTLRIKALA